MSLLCDYSDSSAASSSDDEEEQVQAPQQQNVRLPSAEELFATDTSLSLSSSNSAFSTTQRASNASATNMSDVSAKRTREQQHDAKEAAKRPKTDSLLPTGELRQTPVQKKSAVTTHFAPPQLKRPNVSTEDLGAWNTQKTLAMQRKAKSQPASEKL
uniref:Uncharacterized protein n=1 Tax=Globisporangium ultimum (strain ATCC 200006 / CBS 805.95 / DAOM BR144) TaxID=431595 RepID=K3WD94_GLOUD